MYENSEKLIKVQKISIKTDTKLQTRFYKLMLQLVNIKKNNNKKRYSEIIKKASKN